MEALERKARLGFLLRANAGKAIKPRLVSELAEALGLPEDRLQFLPLAESDAIRHRFAEQQFGKVSTWQHPPERAGQIRLVPDSEGDLFLIPMVADKVGILSVPASVLSRGWLALLGAQPDGFRVVTTDCTCGAVVQRVCEWPGWENLIEIRACGAPWVEWLSREVGP